MLKCLTKLKDNDKKKDKSLQTFAVNLPEKVSITNLAGLSLKDFCENKVNIFEEVQLEVVKHLLPKMKSASFKDLLMALDILQDKIQIISGKSTQNIAVHKIESLVKNNKKVKDLPDDIIIDIED